jgi:type IV secretory pathway VirB10-like protein
MTNVDPHDPPPSDPLAVMLPRATRFRRKLVWGGLAVAGVTLAGVLAYGFLHSPTSSVAKKGDIQTASGQKPVRPDMGSFPQDYSQIKPVQAAAPAPTGSSQQAPPASASRGSGQPTEEDKARASNVFFPQAAAAASLQAVGAAASSAPSPADQQSPYGNTPLPAEAQGGLALQKNAFLNNSGGTRDYVAKPIQAPVSPFEVKAGTIIPAALVTGVNSDLPGEIVAQVTQNVFDTATGRYLLIPQGSRLVGKYDSLVSYGQDRALIVWNRVILPNGDSVDLEGMPGSDESGAAGLQDETNHHRWEFAGALAVSTLLSLGPSVAQALAEGGHNGSDTNVYAGPASSLGSNTSQVGENLLNRELNRPNTITVRPGWPLNVLINRDLVMRGYTNG